MEIFGVRLVGVTADNGVKLLLTAGLIAAVILLQYASRWLATIVIQRRNERARFWARQAISLISILVLLLGILSIWFEDPERLTTALGLVTVGVAFALQKVITSMAGYFVILRGENFTVGDRITMGGVRGDVIALSLFQTTLMEMGQPPAVQDAGPAQWVKSRQFTGRIVTVANAHIFDEPVYNYTRDFPYIWEELSVPIAFKDNRQEAERILLDAAHPHTLDLARLGESALDALHDKYFVERVEIAPRVYWRITDNWLELTVRFLVDARGIRDVKDAMSRHILDAFDAAGIGIASATYDIVGLPPIRVRRDGLSD